MQIEQKTWDRGRGWQPNQSTQLGSEAQLVLVFAGPSLLQDAQLYEFIRAVYSRAFIMGCSTAGEIYDTHVFDDSLVLTAVKFEQTSIKIASQDIHDPLESYQVGRKLAGALNSDDLAHVFVLSEGLKINGTELVNGLKVGLQGKVMITGGLAADGSCFKKTFVCANSIPTSEKVAAVGFYGKHLKVSCGSLGGWDTFGPDRLITKSRGNILYELDGEPALALYKKYLGEHASGLPATGLLFPLALKSTANESRLVRTILAIDEQEQSLIFAGEVPEGSYGRLMKANFDRLIDGASAAAQVVHQSLDSIQPDLAILISCVGRKLVLKQRVEEEVESVRQIFGDKTVLTGFYSYGEIAPMVSHGGCELHNQTMTITAFSETRGS